MRSPIFLTTFLFIFFSNAIYSQLKADIDLIDQSVVVVTVHDHNGNVVGHGSGFLIDSKGTVVTNYHVASNAFSLKVRVKNANTFIDYEVEEIISGDEGIDLAKILIKNPSKKTFQYLKPSLNKAKKGDQCWAIGTPAEIEYMNTITEGIVSNIYEDGISPWTGKMLQVSAPFTHGSSGGALINSKGELVGVTCGGNNGADGARANINWAIDIEELNNLKQINKKSLIDPSKIPCQISFFTNSAYTGSVYLYINGFYVGSFTKYFPNNYTPMCGESGTITRSLIAGEYVYQAYYKGSGNWYQGRIILSPGDCFRVQVLEDQSSLDYYPSLFNFQRKTFEDKGNKQWTIYSGLSLLEPLNYAPIPLFLEKRLNEKFSVRGNVQFLNKKEDQNQADSEGVKYFGFGADLKRCFPRIYRWDWFVSGTLNLRLLKNTTKEYESMYSISGPYLQETTIVENASHGFIGIRFGADRFTSKNFYVTCDYAFGLNTYLNEINGEFNLLLGYRF
jgi:hypothetical protein